MLDPNKRGGIRSLNIMLPEESSDGIQSSMCASFAVDRLVGIKDPQSNKLTKIA